jgi:TRAP transporter 4TM/12TM fusion protein
VNAGRCVADRVFVAVASLLSAYMAVTTFVFLQQTPHHYATLVGGIVGLAGLLALRNVLAEGQDRRGARFWARLILATAALLATLITAGYIRIVALRLQIDQPFLNATDVAIGALWLGSLLVITWFHWGTVLTSVIGLVVLYFFYGQWLPIPILRHNGYEVSFVLSYMGMNTTEGVFAYVGDGVEKLYFLVIFSAVLIGSGMLDLVTELGKTVGRYVRGGAAFPAIIGSTMEGMVMGAAVTNVVMSGKLTIPMMKRYGFRKEFAAAVEVAASTAGQIIPPVMGLAAFIMAALLNISYVAVALIAVIPSALYMVGITIGVLVRSAGDDLPYLREPFDRMLVARLLPTFVVPLAIVVVLLLAFHTPAYAGLFGIAAAVVLCLFQGRFRPSLRDFGVALKEGAEIAIQLSVLILAIGPLAQTFITTNLAGRLSAVLVNVVPDSQVVILLGAMVLALLVGMGLPTPAAYVLVALTLAHFLQQAGIEIVAAHFFIQYFAVFSTITPPVGVACLAGAKIAGASFPRTAIESLKLVGPTFVIPFAFIYHRELLAFPKLSLAALPPIAAVIAAQWALAVAIQGYFLHRLSRVERGAAALLAVIGLAALVQPDAAYLVGYVGLAGVAAVWLALSGRRHAAPAQGGVLPAPLRGGHGHD